MANLELRTKFLILRNLLVQRNDPLSYVADSLFVKAESVQPLPPTLIELWLKINERETATQSKINERERPIRNIHGTYDEEIFWDIDEFGVPRVGEPHGLNRASFAILHQRQ